MSKLRLTDELVARLQPGTVADTLCPGLVVRVTPLGTRSYSVIYKVPGEGGLSPKGKPLTGKQHRITLGKAHLLNVIEARAQARQILQAKANGVDPRAERRAKAVQRWGNTFERAAEQFIALEMKPNVKHWRSVESTLRLHVAPHWNGKPIEDLRRTDVHRLLDHLVSTDKIGVAREVRKHLSRFFAWAENRELASNPMAALRRRDLAVTHDAGRALSDAELRAVWAGAEAMGYPFGPLFQLLLLTGARRAEWANAQRSEIDAANRWLEVPKERHKSKRDHIIPLTDAAWAIVERLPQVGYLFTTRGGRPVSGFTKGKAHLDREAQKALGAPLPYYRIHDFRVTVATRLAALGFSQAYRDPVLGHSKHGLQKIYNRYDYLEEKRAALTAYAEHVTALSTGP
jgi:integrase